MRLYRSAISTCIYLLCRLCMSDFDFDSETVDSYDTFETIICSEIAVLLGYLASATEEETNLFRYELTVELIEGPYLLDENRNKFLSRLDKFLDFAEVSPQVRSLFRKAIETATANIELLPSNASQSSTTHRL